MSDGTGLDDVSCEVRMSPEQHERYQAVATLVFAKGLIADDTLPALVEFLLVGVSEAVTEHIEEIVENLCAKEEDDE